MGADLKVICDSYGMIQFVQEPTRGPYLLDLFLSDLAGIKATVGASIADHKALCVRLPLPEVVSQSIYSFTLHRAEWSKLQRALEAIDWKPLRQGSAEDALTYFMEMLWLNLCTYIPYECKTLKKQSHPWLNNRCEEAIREKNASESSEKFKEASKQCAATLTEEYNKHVADLKEQISKLSKGSKKWWSLNRQLLEKKAKISSIPPLKDGEKWLHDAKEKANLFAKTFSEKSSLPDEVIDTPFFGKAENELDEFICLRSRHTLKLLKSLDESKATGPDRIPAKILKKIAPWIAVPFTGVCRRLLSEGCWPQLWKMHNICPLYKRKSAFQAGNYRGVHLSSILSKVAEKVIGKRLISFLQSGKFGDAQWAFSPGLSSRDLVTALVMSWILSICSGSKVAGYLSDISGAFDRVCKEYLLAKLQAAGVGDMYLQFLNAYLEPRQGQVIVEGTASDPFAISNTVFQGTVLGPPLWNLFFADVIVPAESTGGAGKMFADDLNVFQEFDLAISNENLTRTMQCCRADVHKWGRVNRVTFDADKEHIVVIHPILAHGDPFKLLGCLVDFKLQMHQAMDAILAQIRPKVKSILRTRTHYDISSMIGQFKTHIWGLMEIHNDAIFHAASSALAKIDHVQQHFLDELGISDGEAFLRFNFASPLLRRNIGILGLLHKRVLGKGHPIFQRLLPFHRDVFGSLRPAEHNRQLYGHILEVNRQYNLHDRSIFSMVYVYNRLSQNVVEENSVKIFQSRLTALARDECQNGIGNWKFTFHPRSRN